MEDKNTFVSENSYIQERETLAQTFVNEENNALNRVGKKMVENVHDDIRDYSRMHHRHSRS